MATRRIKDITNTATTFASDDFIALDGATQGTRKMDKDDLIAEVSAGVSGDYLEEANNLSDVASLDTSKLNMEIPDVGTAPNEVPLNGQLGSMAYQSSEGISIAKLQGDNIGLNASPTDARLTITDATNDCIHLTADESTIQGPYADTQIRMGGNIVVKGVNNAFLTTGSNVGLAVDSSGRVGIGTSSPSHKLTVDSGDIQLQVPSSINTDVQSINWKNTNSSGFDIARIQAATGGNIYEGQIKFLTKDSGGTMATRWTINSSGNLVANGTAIDFGSTTGGTGNTVTSGLLDDYEEGTFTPSLQFGGGETGITYSARYGYYTKIGRLVTLHIHIGLTSKGTSTGEATIDGGPFVAANTAGGKDVSVVYPYAMASLISTPYAAQSQNSNQIAMYDTAAGGRDPLTNANFSNTTGIHFTLTFEV
jgi:hypothetical protein